MIETDSIQSGSSTLNSILNFELIPIEKNSLSVYDVIVIAVILLVSAFLLRILKRVFKRQEKTGKLDIGKSHAFFQIIKYVVWIFTILIALDTVGMELTPLLAGSAALLVGLGLGLQQIFQDFLSGITLLIEGTIKIGDVVQTSDGQVSTVKEINLRTSKVETRDKIIVIVPNSRLINENVINWSHSGKTTRFSIKVGVAYGSNVELVKSILINCANKHDKVHNSPEPNVQFKDFGDSSLDFELYFYTSESFYVEWIKSDLRFAIDAAFRENNVTIPFPQRDVHMFNK